MNHGPQRKTPRSERNESNKRLAPLSEFQSWDSADDTLRAQGAAPGPGLHPQGQGAGVCGRARPEAPSPSVAREWLCTPASLEELQPSGAAWELGTFHI